MDILTKVKKTINKYSMLSDGDCVLIGLSGGPDSVCLAVILDKLRKDFNLSFYAVYIDHGLRPNEIRAERDFCENLSAKLGMHFISKSIDVIKYAEDNKLNKQEAARNLRYEVFKEVSKELKATKIALGHNADDQAETFFMRLVRGGGTKGLSGIPPTRDLGVRKSILIIRPLIEIERNDIEKFLSQNSSLVTRHSSLPFMVDSSNLKKDYFRNWLRITVIPELKKRNPSLTQNICRTMDILREENDYLELIVTKTLMRLISRKSEDTVELFIAPLVTMERPLLRRVIRRVVSETEGLRGIDFIHIEDMIALIKTGKPGNSIYLPRGVRVIKEYALFVITSELPVKIAGYELNPPGEINIKEANVLIKAVFEEDNRDLGDGRSSVLLDAGKMNVPLIIRPRNYGDFFFPLGFGKKKKLQDFFVDEKVPRNKRDSIPIIVSGNDIVWVAGYRADERFKVTEKTEKLLRLIISRLK